MSDALADAKEALVTGGCLEDSRLRALVERCEHAEAQQQERVQTYANAYIAEAKQQMGELQEYFQGRLKAVEARYADLERSVMDLSHPTVAALLRERDDARAENERLKAACHTYVLALQAKDGQLLEQQRKADAWDRLKAWADEGTRREGEFASTATFSALLLAKTAELEGGE